MSRKIVPILLLVCGLAVSCGMETAAPPEATVPPAPIAKAVPPAPPAPVPQAAAPTPKVAPPVAPAVAASLAPAPAAAPAAKPAGARNVILISWDGLDRPVVKELLEAGKLPNLAAVAKAGSFREIEVRGHVTVTKPGHAEMLTGLSAQQTGVFSNSVYRPIPEGFTVFERLQKALGQEKIYTIMVTGKLANLGARGPDEITGKHAVRKAGPAPPGADDDPAVEKYGEPFFLTKKHLDVCDIGQRDASAVGPLCLKYLAQAKAKERFFAFLHFGDPDHAGHAHGNGSAEYKAAAVECDLWLGKILEWLRAETLEGETLVYVTTDHGFDPPPARQHTNAPHGWLVTNDTGVTRGGIIADIPATILERFGVDVAALEPKLIGRPLSGPAGPLPSAAPGRGKGKFPAPGATGPAAPARPVGRPGGRPAERFRQLDRNGDGKLTPDEVADPAVFRAMDANGDGVATLEEARGYFRARRPAAPAAPAATPAGRLPGAKGGGRRKE